MRGKSINLFLMDGSSTGRIKCTLANWTGVAYKIPRTSIEHCSDRIDLKQSGVYFLFGVSDESGKPVVYIGQAGARKNGDGILRRLQEHKRNPQKDYWNEAVVFTTSNNSFGPTEISYLENRFCDLASKAKRYDVKNSNDPSAGNITEEKESELEEFIDYAKVIMGTMGHKVFESLAKQISEKDEALKSCEPTNLYLKRTVKSIGTVEGIGKQTEEGFVVLKGSHISTTYDNTVPAILKSMLEKANVDNNGILLEDVLFNSPSYAAMFVIGKSANGLTSWKTSEGITLKELEQTNA